MEAGKQASWEEKLCFNMRLWRQLSVECGTQLFVTKFGLISGDHSQL